MLLSRFSRLDHLLVQYRPFWQCQPFHWRHNCWQASAPELAAFLDTLDEQQLMALDADPALLGAQLRRWFPEVDELTELCALPVLAAEPEGGPAHLGAHIPGRKWQQICQFAAALPTHSLPWLEWCAGKGHLGRLLGYKTGLPVVSLEWQSALCDEGRQLADKADVTMRFVQGDALAADSSDLLFPAQHVVALHACGELHTHLLQQAAQKRVAAISISPCCYHLIRTPDYRPLSQTGSRSALSMSTQDLRLAVQESVTAGQRVQRLRQIELTWRLGFDLLQRELRGIDQYLPLPAMQKSLLSGRFDDFAHWAAGVKGLDLAPWGAKLAQFEQAGAARRPVIARMELVQHLFRRPLEMWLVLDRALYLQEQGYVVELGTFCQRSLTPRNILINAELGF